MFGLGRPRIPISDEQRRWLDDGFLRLAQLIGAHRLLDARTILPTPQYFPDLYDGSEAAVQLLFRRVAAAMQIDADEVDVSIFGMHANAALGTFPSSSSKTGAGGLYFHDPAKRQQIAVNEDQLQEPMSLVAVLAHELGHIVLLRPGLVSRDEPDMEPLNDLLTVFLGLGIFTANSAFRFEQHTDSEKQGWSTRKLGYLSEELFGYALARYAFERGEHKPAWAEHLVHNIAVYFKRSSKWLQKTSQVRLLSNTP